MEQLSSEKNIADQNYELDLDRCKQNFELFYEKYKSSISSCFNFNKVLAHVKVPFSSVPSMQQIKSFFQSYIIREKKRKYVKKGLWSEKELKIFLWASSFYEESIGKNIDEFTNTDWQEISQIFPNSSPLKCKAKWYAIKKSKYMKLKWSANEDKILTEMMMKRLEITKTCWNDIAAAINQTFFKNEFIRTGRHCRDRWVHHLNPKLSHLSWSQEEDLQMIKYVLSNGKKWANLSKIMQNRNEDSIRNRFIKLVKIYKQKEKQERSKKNLPLANITEDKLLQKILKDLNESCSVPLSSEEKPPTETISLGKRRNEDNLENDFPIKYEEKCEHKSSLDTNKKEQQIPIFSQNIQKEKEKETEEKEDLLSKTNLGNLLKSTDLNFPNISSQSNIPTVDSNMMPFFQQQPFNQNIPRPENFEMTNEMLQRSFMNNFYMEQARLHNQLFFQEMMAQRMRMMYNNYFYLASNFENLRNAPPFPPFPKK